ncbi:hypothetical protein [Halostagnicola kamekurae]|nr:hypothetical protein [Halostagnicola kamekurae]
MNDESHNTAVGDERKHTASGDERRDGTTLSRATRARVRAGGDE